MGQQQGQVLCDGQIGKPALAVGGPKFRCGHTQEVSHHVIKPRPERLRSNEPEILWLSLDTYLFHKTIIRLNSYTYDLFACA